MSRTENIPVIAIDGPSASGKGTVAARVAQALGFHYLDSGSIYRLTALVALRSGVSLEDEVQVAVLAGNLPASFHDGEIFLEGEPVTEAIRSEECSAGASRVAALPAVRAALLARQRAYQQSPGLDMGSVVFPQASLKVYLTASAEERASRRYKQLIEKGMSANISTLLQDLQERDARDAARSVAPLQKCADAKLLDTTSLSIGQAVQTVLDWYQQRRQRCCRFSHGPGIGSGVFHRCYRCCLSGLSGGAAVFNDSSQCRCRCRCVQCAIWVLHARYCDFSLQVIFHHVSRSLHLLSFRHGKLCRSVCRKSRTPGNACR